MIVIDDYGDEIIHCDECGYDITDGEDVCKVDDKILCTSCLISKFKIN